MLLKKNIHITIIPKPIICLLLLGIYISFHLFYSYTLLTWKFSYFPRISKISETISKISETLPRFSNHASIKRKTHLLNNPLALFLYCNKDNNYDPAKNKGS